MKENSISNKLENASLQDMIYVKDIKEINWFWINRDIFRDIIYSIDKHDEFIDNEIDNFLRIVRDEDFIDFIKPEIEKNNFVQVKQVIFQMLDEDFTPFDINTYIFINLRYFNKLWIKIFNNYNWILKAMAMDISKYLNSKVIDVYNEYYKGNTRITEELFLSGEYIDGSNKWELDIKQNVLHYYVGEKKYKQWAEGETENEFQQKISFD